MSVGTSVTLLAAATFVGTLGALIKYAGMTSLIAGYDPDRVTDEEGLADFVGMNALYVAGLTLAVAIVEYADPFGGTGSDVVWLVFVVGVFALAIRMIAGARRYEDGR
ncbi:DUF3784 domain-containing protein [Natronobacterium texcoconense]|uniref:DUF3784 domain-containing protein n=1 Tax=Natronobacterium texcoconense TaxID=1095778 RepID=A0A1H1C6I5_NATTX|nr:DUF3784 domain-containing protein [Natronobacterium texcoconense]SDQ59837.1 hypothetical protein SAMN04489842_1291 [Natronobacterium texcoconense]